MSLKELKDFLKEVNIEVDDYHAKKIFQVMGASRKRFCWFAEVEVSHRFQLGLETSPKVNPCLLFLHQGRTLRFWCSVIYCSESLIPTKLGQHNAFGEGVLRSFFIILPWSTKLDANVDNARKREIKLKSQGFQEFCVPQLHVNA